VQRLMSIRTVNPRLAAPVGLVLLAGLLLMGLHAGQLPFINPARNSYQAQFTDAGGLQASDAVQIAGVVVGRVTDVSIRSSSVLVDFTVDKGIHLVDETAAQIKIGNLLGSKYLELEPRGVGELGSSPIPMARTTPAYDVATAFGDLARVEKQLDTQSIANALNVLSGSFQNSPAQIRAAVKGLSDLSHTIASRDVAFRQLLSHAATATGVLDQRRNDVVQILKASDLVLQALQQRKSVIDQLLRNTVSLTTQLQGLVAENQTTLTPALRQLADVAGMLEKHQGDIAATIANMDNYIRTFNNVVGNGPWFDVVIPRLPNSVAVEKR
jgi:phospholipid/cholesterol/gamma-HCH transport system substrate-binding protein